MIGERIQLEHRKRAIQEELKRRQKQRAQEIWISTYHKKIYGNESYLI